MLKVQRDCLRIARLQWNAEWTLQRRLFGDEPGKPPHESSGNNNQRRDNVTRPRKWQSQSQPRRANNSTAPNRSDEIENKAEAVQKKPSLVEQLFPEESKKYAAQQKAAAATAREIPRLPLDEGVPKRVTPVAKTAQKVTGEAWMRRQMEGRLEATGPGTTVLVLRNATKNLIEEDFRRLIPQGKHIEGWTLSEGDILKVIPARDLHDLSHENIYYIVFSSVLSAFEYQAHVTRIHRLAAQHTPNSTASTIPPPPGWMVDGIDVHSAIESYALVPPNRKLELRQLKPPLAPVMELIVKYGGYKSLVQRKGKMPFEVRMTMEGPQFHPSIIKHIMADSGKKRGLSWSGGDNYELNVTRWEPQNVPGESYRGRYAEHLASRWDNDEHEAEATTAPEHPDDLLTRRTPGVVYIIGFHTEDAAQSFVSHWHRRPLRRPGVKDLDEDEGDLPPIANVEMLY